VSYRLKGGAAADPVLGVAGRLADEMMHSVRNLGEPLRSRRLRATMDDAVPGMSKKVARLSSRMRARGASSHDATRTALQYAIADGYADLFVDIGGRGGLSGSSGRSFGRAMGRGARALACSEQAQEMLVARLKEGDGGAQKAERAQRGIDTVRQSGLCAQPDGSLPTTPLPPPPPERQGPPVGLIVAGVATVGVVGVALVLMGRSR